MNIKHLNYFREIVNCEFNLSEAARKLNITQPSLSMLISSWENSYDICLFKKINSRFTGLTGAGEYVYNYATEMLEKQEVFYKGLEDYKNVE
ncbi:MAG: LysR family transcriptional regulator [Bacilli bacterium]|jgi:DNA-binding transcriptional LysR family regulator|nr:LysR family transcriptional regulator [Bacilli bacterium]